MSESTVNCPKNWLPLNIFNGILFLCCLLAIIISVIDQSTRSFSISLILAFFSGILTGATQGSFLSRQMYNQGLGTRWCGATVIGYLAWSALAKTVSLLILKSQNGSPDTWFWYGVFLAAILPGMVISYCQYLSLRELGIGTTQIQLGKWILVQTFGLFIAVGLPAGFLFSMMSPSIAGTSPAEVYAYIAPALFFLFIPVSLLFLPISGCIAIVYTGTTLYSLLFTDIRRSGRIRAR